jgi:hypothetical protein
MTLGTASRVGLGGPVGSYVAMKYELTLRSKSERHQPGTKRSGVHDSQHFAVFGKEKKCKKKCSDDSQGWPQLAEFAASVDRCCLH